MRTRREFLLNCSSVGAGAVLVPTNLLCGVEVSRNHFTSLAQISYSSLASQVKSRFLVRSAGGPTVELTLLEIPLAPTARPRTPAGFQAPASNEGFSLIFSGPARTLLESRIYRFEHASLGQFEMYIGRIGRYDRGQVYYEAVVNRPAPVPVYSSDA